MAANSWQHIHIVRNEVEMKKILIELEQRWNDTKREESDRHNLRSLNEPDQRELSSSFILFFISGKPKKQWMVWNN